VGLYDPLKYIEKQQLSKVAGSAPVINYGHSIPLSSNFCEFAEIANGPIAIPL
jgi:hypothetical protein